MRSLFILCLLFFSFSVFAQNSSKEQALKEARRVTEQKLRSSLSKFTYVPNSIDESKFSFLNADGGIVSEDGILSRIQFLDKTGWPVINLTNSNVEAAITTGADQLQPEGALGLNLTGKGLTVGIFDQTRPKADHIEYGGRLTQIDGSTETLSTHSTHVSGTVMGTGINSAAKGMAYEATAWSFNWDNDVSKMTSNAYDPETKIDGMLLSNHSYSIGMGWEGDNWLGNPSISTEEDWRFGFYSSLSQSMDQVMFSKPYYLPVFAAGNDRSDRGDGTRPPDGPSDILAWRASSKNGLTIGAVEKVLDYQNPQSVRMSTFSSWGPTDDGRIKPDLVGMGVNVFSASINSNGEDSYANSSGTSMAAPNVTGSLFLLQQLYSQRNAGRFMLSSAVKALAIHTAKEAGPAPGPDYMNGWGLLDVAAGAEIILNEDGTSQFIKEDILGDGESFEFEFVSDGVTPIVATLVWTDPAGTPAAQGLDPTDIMLVNDLDMRIFDEEGEEFFPWTLNPSLAASATGINTADNFRDNVEKIEINSPKAQRYRVVISHKGDLEFGVQQYAMVFTAGTVDGADETLYWIGPDGGNWNSPENWAEVANGSPANRIPDTGTRVVFEGNSGGAKEVLFPESANAFSVNFFGNQLVKFNLGGNEIQVTNGFRVSNQITEIENGTLVFSGSDSNEHIAEFGAAIFSNVLINFESGKWRVIDGENLDNFAINSADLRVDMTELVVNDFILSGSGSLAGELNQVSFAGDFTAASSSTLKEYLNIKFIGVEGNFTNNSSSQAGTLMIDSGVLALKSSGFSGLAISNGQARMDVSSLAIADLELGANAVLNLSEGGLLEITENISSSATESSKAKITASSPGDINYPIYRKYCFDFIDVNNVNLFGVGIINLGVNAEVINATGWLQENCDDVLFANFSSTFNCKGAAVTFENLSEGAINEYEWNFDNLGTSTLEEPIFVFDEVGTYLVTLKVSNENGFTMFEQEITIVESGLAKPTIVVNGSTLTSQQSGSSYQWYVNGTIIQGATSRSYEASGDGSYQVAIVSESCNSISDPVVVSAIESDEPELTRFGIFIGPIPSEDQLTIKVSNEYTGPIQFEIIDFAGRTYLLQEENKISTELDVKMNLPGPKGIYILRIKTNNLSLHKKVIKN